MYSPYNAITGNMYQGEANIIALTDKAIDLKTTDPRWLTFLQAQEHGYKVKKGAKGTRICYASKAELKATETPNGELELSNRPRRIFKHFIVFNATQVEGIPEL